MQGPTVRETAFDCAEGADLVKKLREAGTSQSHRPESFYDGNVLSTSRTMPGGFADRAAIPKGANGRPLCRWCNLEVPPRRFTFCSDFCVHEWKLRTDPGYLREQVFQRDRGVCALCGVDTAAALLDLKRARGVHRLKLLEKWGMKKLARRTLWDADHILPVVEGGGECDLDNLRTLCLVCHRRVTYELRRKLTIRYNSGVVS